MSPRVITALVGTPLIIAAVVLGFPFFDGLVFLLGAVSALEMYEILRPRLSFGRLYLLGAAMVVMGFCAYDALHLSVGMVVLGGLALIATVARQWGESAGGWRDIVYPLLGGLYVGVPMALLVVLRSLPGGVLWVVTLAFTVWATDTMALFGGRLFGRHKLAPQISPGKTIEGALTGVVFGIGMGTFILMMGGAPVGLSLTLTALTSLMAVVGDLLESWLKRVFDVKDASGLLPGHGGMLDRLDSFLTATPVFYLLLIAFLPLYG